MGATQHPLASWQPGENRRFEVKKNCRRRKITRLDPSSANGKKSTSGVTNYEHQDLIQQAIAGESEAQTRLFTIYTPRLYRIAFNVLRNKEDAEDAVQDSWSRAYTKFRSFEGRSSLSTWLTRIVINSALMIRRKNKRQVQQTLDGAANDQIAWRGSLIDGRATPEEACGNAEMNEFLAKQIDRLPSTTRTAFSLVDVEGFTIRESTKMLGINESALKSRVLRARHRVAGNIRQLLHACRQKSFIRKNGSAAKLFSSRCREEWGRR